MLPAFLCYMANFNLLSHKQKKIRHEVPSINFCETPLPLGINGVKSQLSVGFVF
jgi:hypothetical protein